jgi:hypothetical protein
MNIWKVSCYIIFVVVFVSCIGSNNKNEIYRPILSEKNTHDLIFCDSVMEFLKIEYSFGSKREKVFVYNYKSKQRIIVWELSGLKNISLDSISFTRNLKRCCRLKINPHSRVELGTPSTVIFKTPCFFESNRLDVVFYMDTDNILKTKKDSVLTIQGVFNDIFINPNEQGSKLKISYVEESFLTEVRFIKKQERFFLVIMDVMKESERLENIFKS